MVRSIQSIGRSFSVTGRAITPVPSSIPDSAIHRYKIDEGTGTTVADSIGTEDGTKSGATWTSGTWVGDYALDGDGTDDYIDLTTLGSFGSNMTTNHAIAFTLQNNGNLGKVVFGNNTNDTQLNITVRSGPEFFWEYVDDGGDALRIDSTAPTFDGNPHRYVFNKTANNAAGMEIHEDASQLSDTDGADQAFDNPSDFDAQPISLLRELNSGGFDTEYLNATIDDVIFYDSDLTSQQIQDDYDRQPWS